MMAPVGLASRHPAFSQSLQTSERNCQRNGSSIPASCEPMGCFSSKKSTCRHVDAPNACVLSYDWPVQLNPSSGMWFHSLQATSQALQPMQTEASVRKALIGITSSPNGRSIDRERPFPEPDVLEKRFRATDAYPGQVSGLLPELASALP